MINDKIPDLSKTKYTKIKRYTALSEKVKANVDLLYLNNELYNAFDISFLKKIYVYFLNKFESNNYISDIKSIIIKNIKYSPYDTLCKLSNIAFVKADKILLNAYNKAPQLWNFNLRSSNYRCVSFILWYLINNLNGSTFTYIDTIKRDMRYKYNISDCLATFNEAIKDKRFTVINDKIMLTSSFLEEKNIPYETQVSFGNCLSLLGYPIFFDFYLEQYDLFIQIIYDKCHQKMTREYFNINSKRKFCKDLGCPLLEIESSDLKYIDSNWLQYEIELCAGIREEF